MIAALPKNALNTGDPIRICPKGVIEKIIFHIFAPASATGKRSIFSGCQPLKSRFEFFDLRLPKCFIVIPESH